MQMSRASSPANSMYMNPYAAAATPTSMTAGYGGGYGAMGSTYGMQPQQQQQTAQQQEQQQQAMRAQNCQQRAGQQQQQQVGTTAALSGGTVAGWPAAHGAVSGPQAFGGNVVAPVGAATATVDSTPTAPICSTCSTVPALNALTAVNTLDALFG
jgi:transcription initiation factor TFIID subunit TAF12